MRLSFLAPTVVSVLVSSAFAGDCDLKFFDGMARATEANRAKVALEKKIDAKWAADRKASKLYFVIPPEGGKEARIIDYSLPAGDKQAIDPKIAKELSRHKFVRVYNRSQNPSLYFMPFHAEGIHGVKPTQDFRKARIEDRTAGSGCSTLNLKGRETLTILSGSIARWGDQIADVERDSFGKIMTEDQLAKYDEANAILRKKLGIDAGASRSPASTEAPIYSDKVSANLVKKLPQNYEYRETVDLNGKATFQKAVRAN